MTTFLISIENSKIKALRYEQKAPAKCTLTPFMWYPR